MVIAAFKKGDYRYELDRLYRKVGRRSIFDGNNEFIDGNVTFNKQMMTQEEMEHLVGLLIDGERSVVGVDVARYKILTDGRYIEDILDALSDILKDEFTDDYADDCRERTDRLVSLMKRNASEYYSDIIAKDLEAMHVFQASEENMQTTNQGNDND